MTPRKVLKVAITIVVCTALTPIAVGLTAMAALLYWPTPFTLPTVSNSVESQISHLYDINGNEIGLFKDYEQFVPVTQQDIPQVLKNAVVASEDRNFYKHGGVDTSSILRAAYADLLNQKIVQGGSTITQQYVRNAYLGREQTLSRKVREAILATRVDNELPKDEILYRYLSTIFYGDGAVGVGAAAQTYFHKDPKDLTLSEAATLVGVLPAPTVYAPRENPRNAETRRKVVLQKMLDQHYITQQQYDDAAAQSIWLESKGPPPTNATLIHSPDSSIPQYPYFQDYVRQYLTQKYGPDIVHRGGLKIQTTIDPAAQSAAEQSVTDSLKGDKTDLQMAMVSVEPETGFVRAFVGGKDYSQLQTDLALGGCPSKSLFSTPPEVKPYCWDVNPSEQPVPLSGGSGRQPGSSFKPFVLATAFSEGIKPTAKYSGAPYTVPHCKPTKTFDCVINNNADGEGNGTYDLYKGTAQSINGVFVRLIHDTGFTQVGDMAKKLGLTSIYYSKDKQTESGSYALGETETSPLDMASAYGVFANRGVRLTPTPIVKVVDSTGKVLEDNTKRAGNRVLDQNVADNVTKVLRGVIENGTASQYGKIGRPAAGKTGTVQGFTDAWFVGYTPTLSTAVWMGHSDDRETIVAPRLGHPYGGNLPAFTWANYMKAALKDVKATDFTEPAPIVAPADLDQVIKDRNAQQKKELGIDVGPKRNKQTIDGGDFDTSGGSVDVSPPTTLAGPSTTTTAKSGSP